MMQSFLGLLLCKKSLHPPLRTHCPAVRHECVALRFGLGGSQYFYEEQLHRMECLSQEPVLFEDVLCQMHDMIQPRCRVAPRTCPKMCCSLAGRLAKAS